MLPTSKKSFFLHGSIRALKGTPVHFNESPTASEKIERGHHFRYLESIQRDSADCFKDVKATVGVAKMRMLDLNNIWKDINTGKRTENKSDKLLGMDIHVLLGRRMDSEKKR